VSRTRLYLLLAVVGAVVPWLFFAAFLDREGVLAFVPALFANGAAAGFSADVLISSGVFWLWMFADARERGIGGAPVCVALNLAIGLSCALPAWLWWRERATRGGAPTPV
jgi:hypothetical protein